MLLPIVDHVTALAERFEVAFAIIRRIVIEVSRRQHDFRAPDDDIFARGRMAPQRFSAPATPNLRFFIIPPTVAEVLDVLPMRSTTFFAPAFRSFKSDHRR